MVRKPRLVSPGQAHHVTQRGNYKQDVFYEEKDYLAYINLVQEYSKKYQLEIMAFCLMPNHVHFIVIPEKPDSLSKTFRMTNMRYAQYLNLKLCRNGHLWQSRFYSCILSPSHLVNAICYVETNPHRAKIVSTPEKWPWSSVSEHLEKRRLIDIIGVTEYFDIPKDTWLEFIKKGTDTEVEDQIRQDTLSGRDART
jgi:putative transposase